MSRNSRGRPAWPMAGRAAIGAAISPPSARHQPTSSPPSAPPYSHQSPTSRLADLMAFSDGLIPLPWIESPTFDAWLSVFSWIDVRRLL